MKNEIYTKWEKDSNLVITRISGAISEAEVSEWKQSLEKTFSSIPAGAKFKIFVNLYGLNPTSVSAHKAYRDIIPLLLSKYNWRIGYLDLFEEAKDLKLTSENGMECLAAVHCHHDSYKINEYERRFGRTSEHFYDDPEKSEKWIRSYPVSTL
ncbi:hypothetical protein ND861_04575 [Leptospira sp. 2 VSF19]|uniref:STAS/SEC14 domain-containing protein n=1 Tax=Leptospira soteropolitanensis TaxID=2950025 RepID=A0AAW5V976_9LEPT|nr:hypothetical protein [Leptospira soteropolitanensis]MCW7491925.1 hypothetical protein [Leptospira soteropolitanensis]MCW7499509.1 hypothetical protein [Leptospira soteropolitanensis]MCW7520900.1 hypothetical protein [Leptospira soteropolitanensis]MCW7525613.1 hypothetical protein [Leptospira soteropolitanensis]MCW7529479.1 hypothetical protein [Leptospira soteropolitanensis]